MAIGCLLGWGVGWFGKRVQCVEPFLRHVAKGANFHIVNSRKQAFIFVTSVNGTNYLQDCSVMFSVVLF